MEGLDLVTEGVITMSKVVEYAKDYLHENAAYSQWAYKRDGASLIARMLFEEATDVPLLLSAARSTRRIRTRTCRSPSISRCSLWKTCVKV